MSDNNFEQRCAIKFCFRLGHNATETFAKLQQAYGDSVLSRAQPPYSPDLSPCDFFLFPKLKNHLKGHHFGTLENIQTAVTDQKAIPIAEFHQCYEEWKERLQRCVASEGSYFEGDNVEFLHAEIVEIEVVSPSIVPSGNFAELKSYCHLYSAQGQRQAYLLPMPRWISWASI
ncbi:putative transposase [Trichonephila clavipes]|nr:putative transposase [Trichonephila clavipes]